MDNNQNVSPSQTPPAESNSGNDTNQSNQTNLIPDPDTGYILVKVMTANGFIPLEGALVTIAGRGVGNREYRNVQITDQSGQTETVAVPAPRKALSLTSGNERPYATYNIDVKKDNYFTHLDINVSVFSGITSIQSVFMIPTSMFNSEENRPSDFLLTTDENKTL